MARRSAREVSDPAAPVDPAPPVDPASEDAWPDPDVAGVDESAADRGQVHETITTRAAHEHGEPDESDDSGVTDVTDDPADWDMTDDPVDSDKTDGGDEYPVDAGRTVADRGRRWASIGGALSLAYVIWYIGDLVLLDAAPRAYLSVHRVYGSFGMRLVFAAVFLGLVFHGLNGLRTTLVDFVPTLVRRDVGLRTIVRFLTFSVWVPGAFALIWPSIRSWFAR